MTRSLSRECWVALAWPPVGGVQLRFIRPTAVRARRPIALEAGWARRGGGRGGRGVVILRWGKRWGSWLRLVQDPRMFKGEKKVEGKRNLKPVRVWDKQARFESWFSFFFFIFLFFSMVFFCSRPSSSKIIRFTLIFFQFALLPPPPWIFLFPFRNVRNRGQGKRML